MNSPEGRLLAENLRKIFVRPVIICTESVVGIDLEDLPSELRLPAGREKRQREFAAGRLAARKAIEETGHKPVFPAVGEAREPVWPAGLTGSITHTSDIALAAVAIHGTFASIGIDIEDVQPLEDSVIASVLTGMEISHLKAGDDQALRLFSYKESIFKCVFPTHRQFIDFKDVEITTENDELMAACIDPAHAAAGIVAKVRGDSCCVDNHVVSACWLPASSSSAS